MVRITDRSYSKGYTLIPLLNRQAKMDKKYIWKYEKIKINLVSWEIRILEYGLLFSKKQCVFSLIILGISVDWLGRNIYWTDSTERSINVGSLDGRYKKTLFSNKVNNPRGIVCHPYKG